MNYKKLKSSLIKNKKLFCFLASVFVFTLILFFAGICLFSLAKTGQNLIIDIINNKPQNFEKNFASWQRKTKYFKNINQFNKLLPEMVGINNQKIYFILLQNNWELRPSGGFIGSYAKIKFKNGALNNIKVQDIYAPDGQLKAHVEPPWPIQTAFQQGWWKLRDSNWEPDFPTASEQINWFFNKGGEEKNNGLIAINLLFIKDLLKITGPIDLPDYDQQINTDNFILTAQKEVEKDFFTGSTQKKDFLSAFASQFILKLKNLRLKQTFQLIKAIKKNLDEKQILITTDNNEFNHLLDNLNWNGALKRKYQDTGKQITDYIYIVDANLGSNKANGYVEKKVTQEINFTDDAIKEKLKIDYINNSIDERPNFEDFWGGLYENFLRVILPIEVENIEIKIDGEVLQRRIEIKEYKNIRIKSIGFFVEVPPLSETTVEIIYEKKCRVNLNGLPLNNYILEIQKQPGIESYSHNIKIKGKKPINKIIKTDEAIKLKLL